MYCSLVLSASAFRVPFFCAAGAFVFVFNRPLNLRAGALLFVTFIGATFESTRLFLPGF
jgi:hypothetical protein